MPAKSRPQQPQQPRSVPGTPQPHPAAAPTAISARKKRVGEKFVEILRLNLDDHLYLLNHVIVDQPADWPIREDLNPTVPFTMTIELLAEIAKRHEPNRKLIRFNNVAAFKWITIENPFEAEVNCEWISGDTLTMDLGDYVRADVTFADEWPEPPAEFIGDIDVGNVIMPKYPTSVMYDRFSFHGPKYRSVIEQIKICERGMVSIVKKQEGKGSLLDAKGQQLGLFLHLTQTKNTISFPVRLNELAFYDDIFDQGGLFENTMMVTKLTDNIIIGNMVLKRDGKIWSYARDFVGQRFNNAIAVGNAIFHTETSRLAEEAAPGVYFYESNLQDNVLYLMSKRYLSVPDREYGKKYTNAAKSREHIVSRIVLKDAVRAYTADEAGKMLYPIEFYCCHDENGRLYMKGYGRAAEKVDGLFVSLAHKENAAAAIVSDKPVGIDLEKIEEKSDSFIKTVFTEKEIALMRESNDPDAPIRFWVAKEACAKKSGLASVATPAQYIVDSVDGDVLSVGRDRVQTMRHADKYIIGWTI